MLYESCGSTVCPSVCLCVFSMDRRRGGYIYCRSCADRRSESGPWNELKGYFEVPVYWKFIERSDLIDSRVMNF